MSKAGGIAYLIKHGRAAMPTVTRTAMPRAKGVKRMADGGLSNANAPLNYGTVPDYVFVPGGMEISADGKPVFKSGRYELREKAAATPATGATGSVGVPTTIPGTGSGGVGSNVMAPNDSGGKADIYGGMDSGTNPNWNATNTALDNAKALTQSVTDRFGLSAANADRLASFLGLDTQSQTLDKLAEVGPLANTGYSVSGGMDPRTAAEARQEAERIAAARSGIAALDPSSPDFTGPQAPAPNTGMSLAEQYASYGAGRAPEQAPTTSPTVSDTTDYSSDPSTWARGGRIQHMATGGIGSLSDHGGFVGSYAQGGRMLKGPGDGLSDHIPAVIGKNKPARLADGEFVVSADVVSGLGGGSTEAGARKLYAMMDRIRKAAHGTKKQVKPVSDKKVLPA